MIERTDRLNTALDGPITQTGRLKTALDGRYRIERQDVGKDAILGS